MVEIYFSSLKTIYSCEIWMRSTDVNILNRCQELFPKISGFKRLALSIKRFTLLRSPLGNKKSKDQYERREYGIYISICDSKASTVLHFLEILYLLPGIKTKILVSKRHHPA